MMLNKQTNKEFWHQLNTTINLCFVPRVSINTKRPCIKSDFETYKKTLTDNLSCINSLLDDLIRMTESNGCNEAVKENVIKIIVIIGEQYSANLWNSYQDSQIVKECEVKICRMFKEDTISQVLKDNLISSILIFLRPKLLKHTWKSFPGAIICYKWIIHNIEKPLLRRHLSNVLPTALIIFDDYFKENQILALECIRIIIDHCSKSTCMNDLNYGEVVFQALEKKSLKVELEMIILLYSCISSLLNNRKYWESNISVFGWTKYDNILSILLDNMEVQNNFEYRYAYIICLKQIFNHSSAIKWSDRITTVLNEYFQSVKDLNTIEEMLDFIKSFLCSYHPKGLNFYITIYISLLKLNYNFSLLEQNSLKLQKDINECMLVLQKECPNLGRQIIIDKNLQLFAM